MLKFLELDVSPEKKVYLTQFISDGCYGDDDENCGLGVSKESTNFYDSGNHDQPYDEESHYELEDNVWIRKEHFSADGEAEMILKWIQREVFDEGFDFEIKGKKLYLKHVESDEVWEVKKDEN